MWRMQISGDELHLVDKIPVITTILGTGWEIQVVADDRGYDASPCPPNLEHAYVIIWRKN